MYCPVCFHDTLKLASSGVVKVSFNGKSKSTSQFFYNIVTDTNDELGQKFQTVVKDYFSYYSNFQNQSIIDSMQLYSNDFKCSAGCTLNINHKVNILGLVLPKELVVPIVEKMSTRYQTPIDLESIEASLG